MCSCSIRNEERFEYFLPRLQIRIVPGARHLQEVSTVAVNKVQGKSVLNRNWNRGRSGNVKFALQFNLTSNYF